MSPASIRPATPPLAMVALVRVGAVFSLHDHLQGKAALVLAGVAASLAVMLPA